MRPERIRRGTAVTCVENPRYFRRLVNAAVDRRSGTRLLYGVESAGGEPIDQLAHLATFSRERPLEWQRRDGRYAESEIRIVGTPVRCLTFDDLLADVNHIDLLHIDAEGYDFELLMLFDFDRLAP